ncbi:MAG: hypothetical protein ACOH1V_03105 [Stenotrophomonas sp.]
MSALKRESPSWQAGASNAFAERGLPKNSSEVARRLQRRLSGFALVMDAVCRDVEAMQTMAAILATGFGLVDEERQELNRIALRLFDAKEVLDGNP